MGRGSPGRSVLGARDQPHDIGDVHRIDDVETVLLVERATAPIHAAERTRLFSIFGVPCNPPPWGTLAAVDLAAGTIRWQVPLGSMAFGLFRGLPNLGGPIVTASGLVFIAAANDDKLRAFDVGTGRELWQASLPAGGQATPMTYVAGGRQFVVIAAGGHAADG